MTPIYSRVYNILLFICAILTLIFGIFLYFNSYDTPAATFSKLFKSSDFLNDYTAGYNMMHNKGYTVNNVQFNCSNPPCDARNRQPLNALLYGGYDTPYIVFIYVFIEFMLCLFLFYVISDGNIKTPVLFLIIPITYAILFILNYEFLHLIIFLCCYETYKKGGIYFAASASLMILARLPLGIAVIIAGLLLTKQNKIYILIPILVLAAYMLFVGNENTHNQQMFSIWENTGIDVFRGVYQLPEFSLIQKIIRWNITMFLYLLGIPFLFIFITPFVLWQQIKKPDKFILISYFISICLFSLFCYAPRYEIVLMTLLMFV